MQKEDVKKRLKNLNNFIRGQWWYIDPNFKQRYEKERVYIHLWYFKFVNRNYHMVWIWPNTQQIADKLGTWIHNSFSQRRGQNCFNATFAGGVLRFLHDSPTLSPEQISSAPLVKKNLFNFIIISISEERVQVVNALCTAIIIGGSFML